MRGIVHRHLGNLHRIHVVSTFLGFGLHLQTLLGNDLGVYLMLGHVVGPVQLAVCTPHTVGH